MPNGIGASFPNGSDIIISKLSSSGGQLVASTFFGGSLNDGLNNSSKLTFNYADEVRGEIEIDSDNNIVVGTCTRSTDFPTLNPIQSNLSSGLEGCVFKLDRHLSNIIWSTYFGGSGDDCIYSIDFNRNNDIVFGENNYVSGNNNTPNMLTTNLGAGANMFQKSNDGRYGVLRLEHDSSKKFGSYLLGISISSK